MSSDAHARGTVLVVDDEATISEIVSRYLERAGYETHTAPDGPCALEAVGRVRPDLVVLDLMMPGMDGLGSPVDRTGPRTVPLVRRVRPGGAMDVFLVTSRKEVANTLISTTRRSNRSCHCDLWSKGTQRWRGGHPARDHLRGQIELGNVYCSELTACRDDLLIKVYVVKVRAVSP